MSGWFRPRSPARRLWALDFETTGLDARRDAILSVGLLRVAEGVIEWGSRYYARLAAEPGQPAGSLGAMATHQLLPDEAVEGVSNVAMVAALEERLAGSDGLLLHGRGVDLPFLAAAFRAAGRPFERPAVVDTIDLILAWNRKVRWLGEHGPQLPTQLGPAHEALGLPPYPAHHALFDALATAEVYLVLKQRLEP